MKLKDYFKKAEKQGWAIGQFNFSSLEQLKGIIEAAKESQSPVILGTSEGESKFLGLEETVALVRALRVKYGVAAFLNLDHTKDSVWAKAAISAGYDAIHFDGSGLPLEENIKQTKEMAKYGHKKGVWVEGEIDAIQGESQFHQGAATISEENLTQPAEAERFVKETKISALAVSIGNIHGIYEQMPHLDFQLLQKIREKAKIFLVLHGGSGIPGEEIRKAVDLGVSKVNFNAELRIAWKEALEKNFRENPNEAKPYKILLGVQEAIRQKVEEKIVLLSSSNKI